MSSEQRVLAPLELLEVLLDLNEDDRLAWLDQHCPDLDLRNKMLAVCRADSQTGGTLDQAIDCVAGALLQETPERAGNLIGQRIGAYRISALLGEGGMATVWLAERCDGSFDQQVAIKCLKTSLVGVAHELHFSRERQILANLEHPGIARLLDGGVSGDGIAYIVMERVEGESLLKWNRARDPTIRDVLHIFIKICAAVEYAHENLVVHHDLKPANILVNRDDQPRLLDFGVADLLDRAAADAADSRNIAMTPEYAAPEQWSGKPTGVAADVYSLGVILCELLAGVRPDPAMPASRSSNQDIAPSRLILSATAKPGQLQRRKARLLRGDLDAIVLKALQKAPEQRYASVAKFSDDIKRHLQHQPVLARRASLGYRTLRFVQRHTAALAAALLIVMVLVGALLHGNYQIAKTRQALAESESVRAFLTGLFESSRPSGATASLPSTHELLDRGADRARNEFAEDPLLRMRMLTTIGGIYRQLGQYPQASGLLDDATALMQAQTAIVDSDLRLDILRQTALLDADQGKLDQAELKLADILEELRSTADRPLILSAVLRERGRLQSQLGRHDEAIAAQKEAVKLLEDQPRTDAAELAVARNDLGTALLRAGHDEESVDVLHSALVEMLKLHGPLHREVAQTRSNLAVALRRLGRYAEAEQLLRDVVAADSKIYSAPHVDAARHLNNLGTLLVYQDKPLAAQEVLQRALEINLGLFGEHHPESATNAANLALAEFNLGHYDLAMRLQRGALAQFVETYGTRHYSVAVTQNHLARSLAASGETAQARTLAEQSLALKLELRGADSDSIAPELLTLAEIDAQQGLPGAGIEKLDQSLNLKGIVEAIDTAKVLPYQLAHARLMCETQDRQAGLSEIDNLLAQTKLAESSAPLLRAEAYAIRGNCLHAQGQIPAARQAWQQALDLRKNRLPEDHPDSRKLVVLLAADTRY